MGGPTAGTSRTRTALARAVSAVLATGAVLAGCNRSTTPTATPETAPAIDPAVVQTTPPETARTLCHFLRAHLQAVAARDTTAADAARDQIAWHLAARENIVRQYEVRWGRPREGQAWVVRQCVESWAGLVAYYVNGLDFDQAESRGDAQRQIVRVPAVGPKDRATLEVACLADADGRWRVYDVSMVAAAMPAQPGAPAPVATQPAGGSPAAAQTVAPPADAQPTTTQPVTP